MNLNRRNFLAMMAWGTAIAATPLSLSSCNAPLPNLPWGLLEELLRAYRGSPDHLATRSVEVVATGDPQLIFQFVRDKFLTIPRPVTWHNDGVRWGARGLLRSGMGTDREKSDLLKHFYDRAGFESEIWEGAFDIEKNGWAQAFLPYEGPLFAPTLEADVLAHWKKSLQVAEGEYAEMFDLQQFDLEEWAQKITHIIPENFRYPTPNWKHHFRTMSLVRVKVNAEWVFANPNLTGAAWGEHQLEKSPRKAYQQDAIPSPTVSISLEAAYDDNPYAPQPLVTGEWSAEQLMGRMVTLDFASPGEEPLDLLQAQVKDISSFVPVLSLKGFDMTEAEQETAQVVGDVITLEGQVIRKEEAERISLMDSAQFETDPTRAAEITHIELFDAKIANFPKVKFKAHIRDAGGKMVYGIPAGSFQLEENGSSINIRILENQPIPPRVIIVFDASGSMPVEYGNLKKTEEIVRQIVGEIQSKYPEAEFKISSVGDTRTLLHKPSGWLHDVEAMIKHLEKSKSNRSHNWSALVGATSSDADLAVLITDADGSENQTPYLEQRLAEGIPAVILGVKGGATREEQFQAMADRSKGIAFLADQQLPEAVSWISQRLDVAVKDRPYLLECDSPHKEVSTNSLILTVKEKDIKAELKYEVPPIENRKPIGKDTITGLYLRISINNMIVTRTLAGASPAIRHLVDPITQKDLDHVQTAFFGTYTLTFEGAPPTISTLLADAALSQLSMRPLAEAMQSGGLNRMLDAVQDSAAVNLPFHHLPLHYPLDLTLDPEQMLFPEGYRIVLHATQPNRSNQFEVKADILPFYRWHSLGKDPKANFFNTVQHTLQLSAMEAANFEITSLNQLKGKSLQYISHGGTHEIRPPGADRQTTFRWEEIGANFRFQPQRSAALIAKDLSTESYLWLDQQTGTILGILPDGSGGGRAEIEEKFSRIAKVIDIYEQIFSKLTGFSGLGVWAKLEKAKLEHLKLATIAIILMDGSITREDFEDLLKKEIEDEIKDKLKDKLKKMFPLLKGADDMHKWLNTMWKTVEVGIGSP